VNSGECSTVHSCPAQSKMSGPGPAWSKKKKYFRKFVTLPRIFLLNFA
jgi:hypothetical protein